MAGFPIQVTRLDQRNLKLATVVVKVPGTKPPGRTRTHGVDPLLAVRNRQVANVHIGDRSDKALSAHADSPLTGDRRRRDSLGGPSLRPEQMVAEGKAR